jgi:AraC-like DNA-binding protein
LLVARVAAVIGDTAAIRPPDGAFAFVEHVWHLAEIEIEAFQWRLAQLASEPAPWLPNFDGDRLARERRYLARDVAAGVRAFRRARMRTARELGRLRGAAWLRGGIQEHVGYVTLGELPERMLAHDRSHAAELAALLAAIRPGHALIGELERWCAGIVDAAPSPCRRQPVTRVRTASALPLARVQQTIARQLATGDVTTATLARALGVSPRTLQRRLAEHGLTVQCMIAESIRALAYDRMRAGADWRVAAHELGFSDPRAFSRAFKRWTRLTPSAYQRQPSVTRHGCV